MFKIYTRYGIIIAVLLIAYFLILKLLGLHKIPVLSAVNGVIFAGGIWMAMKNYKAGKSKLKYEKGFQVGLFTGGFATIIFTIFMAIYMYQLDSEFSDHILKAWELDFGSGTLMILIMIVFMGFSTSFVLTLSFMQLLKESWNTPDGKRNTL